MTATAEVWSETLTELLHRQQGLVDRLAELAGRQRELIEAGSADALLALLGRRQTVIDEFVRTQEPMAELTAGMDGRLSALPPERRDAIRTLIDRISTQLAEVMSGDEQDGQTLKALRDGRRAELTRVDAARTARNAYLNPASGGSRFADRRG